MKKLIIDRSKWRTGQNIFNEDKQRTSGMGETQLHNRYGYQCCLGFFCNQAGIPENELIEVGEPQGIESISHYIKENDAMKILVRKYKSAYVNTLFTKRAISINDGHRFDRKKREEKIKEHFGSVGINVVFKGRYED